MVPRTGRLRSPLRAVLLVLLAVSSGCLSPRLERERWIEVTSPNFVALSNADEQTTTQLLSDLEIYRSAVLQLTGVGSRDESERTFLYILRNARTWRPFAPTDDTLGFVRSTLRGNYLAMNAGARSASAERVIFHEYIHLLLRDLDGFQFPAWFDEGFAEFMSTISLGEETVEFGRIPPTRVRDLRYGQFFGVRLGFAALANARSSYDFDDAMAALFYAESWLATHFFYAAHAADSSRPNRAPQLSEYLALTNAGEDPSRAAREAFGVDLNQLQREMDSYLSRSRFPYLSFPRDRFDAVAVSRIRTVPTPEATRRLGDLLVLGGEGAHPIARRLYDVSLLQDPSNPLTLAGLALVSPGEQAIQLFERALRLAPESSAVLELFGAFLLSRVDADASTRSPEQHQDLERAYRLLRRSIELDPESAFAHYYYGASLRLDEDELPRSIDILERARKLMPGSIEIRLQLGLAYVQAERYAEAVPHLRAVRSFAHAGAEVEGAAKLLESIEKAVLDGTSKNRAPIPESPSR